MAVQEMLANLKKLNIGSIVELTASEGLMSTKDNLPSWMYAALYESNSVRNAWKSHQSQLARTRTAVTLSRSTDEVFVKPGEAIKIFYHVGGLDLNNFKVHVVTSVTQQQTTKGAQTTRWVDITTEPPSGLHGGIHDMEPQFQIIKPDGDDGPVAMGMSIRIEKQLNSGGNFNLDAATNSKLLDDWSQSQHVLAPLVTGILTSLAENKPHPEAQAFAKMMQLTVPLPLNLKHIYYNYENHLYFNDFTIFRLKDYGRRIRGLLI